MRVTEAEDTKFKTRICVGIGRSLSSSVFAGMSYGSRHGSPDSSELVGRYPRENAETDLKEASRIENEVQQDTNTSRFQNSSNFMIFSPTTIDDRLTP